MARNIIGPQVRRLRDRHGWSQADLAGRLQRKGWDLSRGTLAKIEAQVRCVTDIEIERLAVAMQTDVAALFPRDGKKIQVRRSADS